MGRLAKAGFLGVAAVSFALAQAWAGGMGGFGRDGGDSSDSSGIGGGNGGSGGSNGSGGSSRQNSNRNEPPKTQPQPEVKKLEVPTGPIKSYRGYFICSCSQMGEFGPDGKNFHKTSHDKCVNEKLPLFFKPVESTDSAPAQAAAGQPSAPATGPDVPMLLVGGSREAKGNVSDVKSSLIKKVLDMRGLVEVKGEVLMPGREATMPVMLVHKVGELWEGYGKVIMIKQHDPMTGGGMFGEGKIDGTR